MPDGLNDSLCAKVLLCLGLWEAAFAALWVDLILFQPNFCGDIMIQSRLFYSLAFALVLLSACTENPIVPEKHAEATGFALFVRGTEVYRSITTASTDTIHLSKGVIGPVYDVQFIAEDGDLFNPDEKGLTLSLVVADSSIVGIETIEPEGWRFSLIGRLAGGTTAEVVILHGGHADFRSEPFPIVVGA